jgi:HEPN domain-containing protein
MVDAEFVAPWIQRAGNDISSAYFLLLIPKCEYLLPFATQTRYPTKIELEDEDMKKALSYAQAIIEFVKSRI